MTRLFHHGDSHGAAAPPEHLPRIAEDGGCLEILSDRLRESPGIVAIEANFRAVIDLHELKRFDMTVIKLLFTTMQVFRELALQYVLVGNAQIVSECKGFEDTKGWQFVDSLEEAKVHLSKGSPALATAT